jgi:hypothetical protein
MSVTLYQDAGGYGYYDTFSYATSNLENYAMTIFSDWNDEVSALYTTYDVYVYEDAYGGGDSALLAGGYFWDLDDLEAVGIDNDSISSFYYA